LPRNLKMRNIYRISSNMFLKEKNGLHDCDESSLSAIQSCNPEKN
jgi:hypothetical protein